jgi:N-acetylneuraminic acid mutarotase
MLFAKREQNPKTRRNRPRHVRRAAASASELNVRWFQPSFEPLETRKLLAVTLQGIPDYVQEGPGPITGGQADVYHNEVAGAINAVVPIDSNHLLVGTVNGGIWRTANATADHPEWTPLTDQYPSLSINTLVSGGEAIYAGLGDDSSGGGNNGGAQTGILRSTDDGDTWQQFGEQPPVSPLTVNPIGGGAKGGLLAPGVYQAKFTFTNATGESTASLESAPFTVAVHNIPSLPAPALPPGATGVNVYLTPPGGASNSEVLYAKYAAGGNLSLSIAAEAFADPPPAINTLSVVGHAADPALGGLSGLNVSRIVPVQFFDTVYPPNAQIVLAGTNQGVFLSQDGGQSWSNESARTGSGLPSGSAVSDLALAVSQTGNGDVLYAAIPGQGIYSAVLAPGGEVLEADGHFGPIIPTQAKLPLSWVLVNGGPNLPPVANNTSTSLADPANPKGSMAATPVVNPVGGGTTGGSLPVGSYFLEYTWTDGGGETLVSPESAQFTVTTAGSIPQMAAALPPPPGATGLNIYLTPVNGPTGSEMLYASGTPSTPFNLAAGPPTITGLNGQATPYQRTTGTGAAAVTNPVFTNVRQANWIDLAVHDSTDGDFVWAALVQPTSSTASPFFGNQFVGIFESVIGFATTSWQSWGVPSDSDGPVDPIGETSNFNGAIVAGDEGPQVVGGGPVLYIGGDGEAASPHEGKVFRGTGPNQWTGITGDQESPIDTDFGRPHADTRSLFGGGYYLYACTDGGLYQLNNASLDTELADHNGDTPLWRSLNGNMFITELYQVAAISSGLIGAAQDNGVNIQRGSGQLEWNQIDSAGTGDGFEVQGAGNIAYFMNNGNISTWDGTGSSTVDLEVVAQGDTALTNVDPNAGFVNPTSPLFVVDAVDSTRLLFGTGILYESLDSGDSLNILGPVGPAVPDNDAPVAAGGDGGAYDAFEFTAITALAYGGNLNGQPNPGVAWVAAGNVLQVRKQDGDTFHLVVFPGASIQAITLDPANCQIAYVIDSNGTVWKTPDGGASWQNLTGNLANFSTDLRTIAVAKGSPDVLLVGAGKEVVNPATGVPAAGSGGIYRLINPDQSAGPSVWSRYGRNLPDAIVTDLHVIGDNILVGTFGRSAFVLPSARTSLTAPGVITVNGDDDPTHPDDHIVLSLDANNPLLLDVTLNGAAPTQVPVTAVSQINVNGGAGADTLTVDFRNGEFVLPGGINYDGGGGGDTLVIWDDNGVRTYGPDSGPGKNGDGTVDGTNIQFKNLAPVFFHNTSLFTLTTPNSGNNLTLDTPLAGALRISGTSGGFAFEQATLDTTQHVVLDLATNDGPTESDTVTTAAVALLAMPGADYTLHTGANVAGNVLNLDAQGHDINLTPNAIQVVGGQPFYFDTLGTINLLRAGNVTVNGVAGDTLVVNASGAASGNLRLDNGPLVVFDTLASLRFVGKGVDSFAIHNPAGTIFAPNGGIRFESDDQAGFLELDGGGGAAFVETDNNGPAAGAANLVFAGPAAVTIGLSGVLHISDTVPVGQLVINATDAADSITLEDGAALGDPELRATIDNFPVIEFAGKTALVLNGGLTSANLGDTIDVNYHQPPTGLTAVTIDSGSGNGVVNIIASPLLPTEIDTGDGHDLIAVNSDFTVPLTVVGGSGTDTIYGGAGNDVTVRTANLTIDESAASIASILTLTNSLISGWEIPATGLSPVVHVDALSSLTIDAAAGDRFDLEEALQVTINNASATRDAVYDMATGGVLNGDFSLDMGWRLRRDGTITKPETLQGLNATMIVDFSTASSTATQVVFDGNLDPAGAAYTIGNDKLGNLLVVNQTVGLTVQINGYRDQDQVWVDLPGGSVAADLTHTGPGTIYLDGSTRLTGTNAVSANQIALKDRAGIVTMQADGDNHSVVQMFNTLYLLGSMPQDSLALMQPTDFKVTPSDAIDSQKPPSQVYIDAFGSGTDSQGNPIYKLGVGTPVAPPPPGFVVFLSSPAILDPASPYSYFTDFTNGYEGWSTPAPSPVNVTPPSYVGRAGIDYQDTVITYDSIVGTVTIPIRVFAISPHPVPIDNTVNLDASQLRGTFSYTANDPDYDTLREIIDNVFGEASFAFGKTTVNLTQVNPELSVAITGQDPPINSQGGLVFPANELADNRIPITSVNVGQGMSANIQGNVTIQLAQLTVDDGQGSLAGILTLTDTSLTGWTTRFGTTQPTLFFDTFAHDELASKIAQARDPFSTLSEALLEYPDVLLNLHDDFVITGSPVDQFDVEDTPTTGSAMGAYLLASANQTLIQNLATSGTPANIFVMGKALPRLQVLGNFALTIGRRLNADGTIDDVGSTQKAFYQGNTVEYDSGTYYLRHSMAITYEYTGIGQGPLVVDDSNDNLVNGVASNYDGIVTGVFANTDYPGHGYLRSRIDPQNAFDGDIVIYGPNTAVSYYSTQYYRHSVQINNTIAATVHYVVYPANDLYGNTQIEIGAATGPVEVQGNGANTFVTIDPALYSIDGVPSTSLRNTITADVSVSDATLQIVADTAGASPPTNPPNVVLSAEQVTGVATATVHFHDLVNSQDGVNTSLAGFALSVQLPRAANVSTVIQDTPAGIITEITTAAGATAGPVLVSGTTGTLWLGRTLNYEFDYSYYSDPAKYDSNYVEAPFSAALVTIGTGSLQGVTGPVFLDYSTATPTTIDDHADAAGRQAEFSAGPTPSFNNNTSVEFYPYELNIENPIYFGYAFLAAPPAALTVLGAALTDFTVAASPAATRLFAGAGSTVDLVGNADSFSALDILGAASVHDLWEEVGAGAPITVEADPARQLDRTDLTVTSYLYLPIDIGDTANGFDSITTIDNAATPVRLLVYEADTTRLTFQDDGYYSHAMTVTDTAAGTVIVPDYYGQGAQVYVQGTTGPLRITDGPTTQIVLGNAGSTQALLGEIDIVADGSGQAPLPVVLDDSKDGTGRSIAVSLDDSGDMVINGLAPAAVRLLDAETGVALYGGTGDNALVGPDSFNAWQLTGVNSGTLDHNISFTNIANLQGGASSDTFSFQVGGSLTGNLDGGPNFDTLDYSAVGLTTAEPLDLAHGMAPLVGGMVANIENVSLFISHVDNQTSAVGMTIAPLEFHTLGGLGGTGVATFTASGLPDGLSIDPGTGSISGTIGKAAAGESPFQVVVTATDGVNTATATFQWIVSLDFSVTDPGNQVSQSGDTVDLAIQTTTSQGQSLQFSASGLPTGLTIDAASGVISGTVGSSQTGADLVSLAVSDGVNTLTVQFFWSVSVERNVIVTAFDESGEPIQQASVGQPINLRFVAYSGNAPDPTYSGYLFVDGYGYLYASAGVGEIYDYSFQSPGSQTLTFYDYPDAKYGGFTITVLPAVVDHFAITPVDQTGAALTTIVAETPATFDVTAFDTFGNVATGYNGTVSVAAGDGQALLDGSEQPITSLMLSAGVGSLSATLDRPDTTTISATDSSDSTLTGSGTITIESALSGMGADIKATAGTAVTGVVATFNDQNASAQAGDFTANIAWGDGTASAGTVTANDKGGFNVTGTKTYAVAGSSPIGVTVTNTVGDVFTLTASGSWANAAAMPEQRYHHSAVTGADGRIYVLGGDDQNGNQFSAVDAYDAASNTWASAVTNLPVAPYGFAATAGNDGRIYVLGGYDANGNVSAQAAAYDPASNLWTTLSPLPIPLEYAAAVTGADGRIYLLGGYDGNYNVTAGVEVYDPAQDTWSSAAEMPTGRVLSSAVMGGDGRIYVLGGYNQDVGYDPSVDAYDPVSNTWASAVTNLPVMPYGFAAATGADGRLYVLGGNDASNNVTAQAEAYDPAADTWATLPTMSTARAYFAAATLPDGRIFALGGYGNSDALASVEDLTDFSGTATVVAASSLALTTISVSSVTVPYDGQPHGATAEVYGPGNLDLGPATISYPGGLVPVEVGTYSVTASFTGTNRYAADTITIPNAITITQDTPTVTATSDNTTYNGSPEAYPDSDVTVTGANHLNNSGGTLTYTYNGSATVPTTAGTYAVLATFKPSDTTDYAIVTGTATWTIKSAPPVAHDDVYSASSLTETDIGAAAGVLFNDADASGDRLTAVLDSATRHGTLTLHADGSFSYVPFSGYVGDDRFSYHTADGALVSGEAVVTIHVYAPAQVTQVAVNSDATQVQRSQILNLQVSFSELVDLGSTPAAAFQLVGPDGQQVNLVVVITTNAAGGTVATLTFLSGPDTFKLATGQFALVDGRYQLTVLKDSVHDANGHSMDADTIDKFFRLFGDARGTGLVDNGDLTLFRKAYNTASSSANYRWYFDENMDGRIDSVDLSAFQSDYYKKV